MYQQASPPGASTWSGVGGSNDRHGWLSSQASSRPPRSTARQWSGAMSMRLAKASGPSRSASG